MMNFFYPNQTFFANNSIININNQYNIAKSTIKIILNYNEKGSGFFLKFIRNSKPFYCLMANQHIITSDFVRNKNEILVKYDNEKYSIIIKLDSEERIIVCFEDVEMIKVDVTLVEIIPKDNIPDQYFLMPNIDYSLIPNYIQNIKVVQYPSGNQLSVSNGIINGIAHLNLNYFYHNATTEEGSSGSPIVLPNDDRVIAIHKGKFGLDNVGIFIKSIIYKMQRFQRNGKYKEFYKNGDLKYEGNFINDEYNDDNGLFHFEDGNIYIGQFKNGQKHGKGYLLDNNFVLIRECIYENNNEINNDNTIVNFIYNTISIGGEVLVKTANIILTPFGYILEKLCSKCNNQNKLFDKLDPGIYKCQHCGEICLVKEN